MKPVHPAVSGTYAALVSAGVMALIGALGIWAGEAWLFPSLGPTIFLQAVTPHEPAARAWNTLVGHAIGLAAGFGALYLFGAELAAPVMSADVLSASRVGATAVAVGATIALQSASRSLHPPAAATTMLITLGGFKPGPHSAVLIASGVVLVTLLGELARRLHPTQLVNRQEPQVRAGPP